jgi:ParB family chromosome partitioning protein
MSDTITNEGRTGEILYVDPKTIIPDPDNPRLQLREIEAMAASIRTHGVLQPITVRPAPPGSGDAATWQVVYGHRRLAGALLAELYAIPCVRFDNDADERTRAVARMVENQQRDDFTPAEEARGIQQLFDLGMDADAIATDLAVPIHRVHSAAVIGASAVAQAVAEKHNLSFDQALALAEFEDNREAVVVLTKIAVQDPRNFDHHLSRLRKQRDDAAVIAAASEKYTKRGYAILSERVFGVDGKAARINYLVGLNSKAHAKCPGRAVYLTVDYKGKVDAEEVCTDFKANSHKVVGGGSGGGQPARNVTPDTRSEAEKEAESQTRRIHLAAINAGRAAQDVRRTFVAGLLKRRAPAKGMLRFATEQIMGQRIEDQVEEFCALTGQDKPRGMAGTVHVAQKKYLAGLSEAQLPMALFARVAADIEEEWEPNTWNTTNETIQRRRKGYLGLLVSAGYTPSTVEKVQAFGAKADTLLAEAAALKVAAVRAKQTAAPSAGKTAPTAAKTAGTTTKTSSPRFTRKTVVKRAPARKR